MVRGIRGALLAFMIAASTPSRSLTLSTSVSSPAPGVVERVLGQILIAVIHAIESVRDSRGRLRQ
jgi:hypothetical protein